MKIIKRNFDNSRQPPNTPRTCQEMSKRPLLDLGTHVSANQVAPPASYSQSNIRGVFSGSIKSRIDTRLGNIVTMLPILTGWSWKAGERAICI